MKLPSILTHKQAIATLFSSAMFFCLNIEAVKACVAPSERSILLGQQPTKLHEATFMGKIEITRSTSLQYMTLIRGIIEESKTHPYLVGQKVTFIHEGTLHDYFCPMRMNAGLKGYVIGREMKLNTDALIVDPYVADNFTWSVDGVNIDTGKDEFPLKHFYEP